MFKNVFVVLLISVSAMAAHIGDAPQLTADQVPKEFEGVGITEKLGDKLDLSQQVRNEKGELVSMASFFDGEHPVILSPVYFNCPGLCNYHLNGLTDALKELDWSIGSKFKMISLSFDPRETSETAAKKKESYLKLYTRPDAENAWHFVTADEATVKAITEKVGFQYKWNDQAKEWAHASAAIVLTPDGKISRYLHGILFDKNAIKLALGDATGGRIGNVVEQMVWRCFKWDPHTGKYTFLSFRLLQIAAVLTVFVLGVFLVPFWLRSRRDRASV